MWGVNDETAEPDSTWREMGLPRLYASIEDDAVTLRLEMNNARGSEESLTFNRRTGRALLEISGKDHKRVHKMRCVAIQ